MIYYTFDGEGKKLAMSINTPGANTEQYNGIIIYQNQSIFQVAHEEGRLIPNPNPGGQYLYEYNYKDNVGNIRQTFADNNNDGYVDISEIRQEQHYYPFGLKMDGATTVGMTAPENERTFNGNKWQGNTIGLNLYDFNARQYNPYIGRFYGVDPLATLSVSQTPMHFANNNPIRYNDPIGLFTGDPMANGSFTKRYPNNYIQPSMWDGGGDGGPADGSFTGIDGRSYNNDGSLRMRPIGLQRPVVFTEHYTDWYYSNGEYETVYEGTTIEYVGGGNYNNDFRAGRFGAAVPNARLKTAGVTCDNLEMNETSEIILENNDGYITFEEAYWTYKLGEGLINLVGDLDKLDLSTVSVSDFKFEGQIKGFKFDGEHYVNANQALVYGTLDLMYIGNNKVVAIPDRYDFEPHFNYSTYKGIIRDVATMFASYYHGGGTSFMIYLSGSAKIKD